MTPIEEKSVATKIQLYKDILSVDNSIMYSIDTSARNIFNDCIKPRTLSDKDFVTMPVSDFLKIKEFFVNLSSGNSGLEKLSILNQQYIQEKEIKGKIINMLGA